MRKISLFLISTIIGLTSLGNYSFAMNQEYFDEMKKPVLPVKKKKYSFEVVNATGDIINMRFFISKTVSPFTIDELEIKRGFSVELNPFEYQVLECDPSTDYVLYMLDLLRENTETLCLNRVAKHSYLEHVSKFIIPSGVWQLITEYAVGMQNVITTDKGEIEQISDQLAICRDPNALRGIVSPTSESIVFMQPEDKMHTIQTLFTGKGPLGDQSHYSSVIKNNRWSMITDIPRKDINDAKEFIKYSNSRPKSVKVHDVRKSVMLYEIGKKAPEGVHVYEGYKYGWSSEQEIDNLTYRMAGLNGKPSPIRFKVPSEGLTAWNNGLSVVHSGPEEIEVQILVGPSGYKTLGKLKSSVNFAPQYFQIPYDITGNAWCIVNFLGKGDIQSIEISKISHKKNDRFFQ